MKKTIPLFTFTFAFVFASAAAALPEDWDVELAAQPPQVFTLQRPRGETYELKAVLKRHGKPFEPAITNACIFWQTNGMENLYWSAPASVSNNVLRATWLPSMDPGATTVRGYIGDPGHIYAAAFQFRFIASPGATPNELPLPQKVIDFAKVTVLNPPWSGGGGGGVDTNAVIDIIHKTVDGSAKTLPKYLWLYEADDSYPDAAAEYYRSRGNGKTDGGCSSVRDGGFLYRNFDYPFDDRAEFVVKMSAGNGRFASVGVAQVGTNLTERMVTSGKPEYSRLYKWLPGATVDGINENGVACNINVVDGDPHWEGGASPALHPLAAVRWILDNATNAQSAAEYIASRIAFPQGWTQNFHYMIADERETWFVENGIAYDDTYFFDMGEPKVMTNFMLAAPWEGETGWERFLLLYGGRESITNAWYTRAYRPDTTPPWVSEFVGDWNALALATNFWARAPKETHRGESFNGTNWWQTVHTSIYDLTNRVLRVAVQEQDDWYVFQVPSSGAKVDAYTKAETDAKLSGKASVSDGFIDDRVMFIGKDQSHGGAPIINTRDRILDGGDWFVNGDVECDGGHSLKSKANRPVGFDPLHAGNIAALDENGDLADSGKKAELVVTMIDPSSPEPIVGDISINGEVDSATMSANTIVAYEGFTDAKGDLREGIDAKADRSMISATNETFAAEVLAVQVSALSTNITAEVYIAATNACANLGIDPALIPGAGTTGTVGGIIVMLFAVVFWMRKKIFDNGGKVNDDFATNLMQKQVAKEAMAYKVATTAGENRSVKVYTVDTGNIEFSVAPPTGATGVIDYEVWLDARLVSALPTITINGTYTTNTGKTILEGCAAGVINIIHCTFVEGAGVTAVVAQFKGVTA